MPARRPLGRLPEDRSKPRLLLTPHLRATPPPPASADWYSHVPAWGTLGNTDWGDCVFAGTGHIAEQQTAAGEGTEVIVTDAEILAAYTRVTGFDPAAGPPGQNPTDNGALLQDGLADLRRNGLAGQKIAAFARLADGDEDELRTAVAQLGCAAIGVRLPQSALAQFDAGEPWTLVPDDGGIAGGHAVTAFGYDQTYIYLVSWGKVVPAAWDWLRAYCGEAWAVVSQDWAGRDGRDPEGVDLHQLGNEFAMLTGSPNPFPAPPAPPPHPAPGPAAQLAELAAFIREVAADTARDVTDITRWLSQHGI